MTDEAQRARGCEVTTPPTERPALLACPFCGEQPVSRWHGARGEDDDAGYWGIDCCQAFAHESDEAAAITAWNTRHPPALPTPALAGLVRRLEALLIAATPLPWKLHHRCVGYDGPPEIGVDEQVGLGWDWVDGSAPPEPMRGVFARGADAALVMEGLAALPTLLAALAAPVPGAKWEAGREAAAKWHDQMARASAPGTGHAAKHEWYAEQIRALALPAPPSPAEGGER